MNFPLTLSNRYTQRSEDLIVEGVIERNKMLSPEAEQPEVFDYTPLTVTLTSQELAQRVEILHDIIPSDEDVTEEEQKYQLMRLAENGQSDNESTEWIQSGGESPNISRAKLVNDMESEDSQK